MSQREKAIWEAGQSPTDVAADMSNGKRDNDNYDAGTIPSWLHTLKRRQDRGQAFQVPWPPRGVSSVDVQKDGYVVSPYATMEKFRESTMEERRQMLRAKGVTSGLTAANDNYASLRDILDAAFAHAATGKGKERHARDLPFDKQPMMTTARQVGVGFALGQAIKKAGESAGMIERGQIGAAEAECLGAINYLAGAILWMRERADEKRSA